MYSAFVNSNQLTPLWSTFPAMFAKSSFIWGTLLYMTTNNEFKSKINRYLFMSNNSNINSISTNKPKNITNKVDL